MDKFKTKSGWLTPYALACGYIEEKEANNIRTQLWYEGNCLHVRQYDFNNHERVFWDSFARLADARKRYQQAIKG